MKKNLHPTEYRPVVFSDEVAGFAFLTRPFFTGEEKIIDTEGRVDRFKRAQEMAEARKAALANKAKKQAAEKAKKAER